MEQQQTKCKMLALPTELLEMIFDALPFPSLIACQKVCKQCSDIVSKSTHLQRTLACRTITTYVVHPIPGMFQASHIEETPRKLCPLLVDEGKRRRLSTYARFPVAQYLRESEVWAPVYISSPPVHEVTVRLVFRFVSGSDSIEVPTLVLVRSPDERGLTLGQAYDMVMSNKTNTGLKLENWPDREQISKAFLQGMGDERSMTLADLIDRLETVLGVAAEPTTECWVKFHKRVARE